MKSISVGQMGSIPSNTDINNKKFQSTVTERVQHQRCVCRVKTKPDMKSVQAGSLIVSVCETIQTASEQDSISHVAPVFCVRRRLRTATCRLSAVSVCLVVYTPLA